MAQGQQQRRIRPCGQPRRGGPFIQELLQIVTTGQLGNLAAFFLKAHPAAGLLDVGRRETYGENFAVSIVSQCPGFAVYHFPRWDAFQGRGGTGISMKA